MITRCLLYHIAGVVSVFAVPENPLAAIIRRQPPADEEQRLEVREAGHIVASSSLQKSIGRWRIQLKAGNSTGDTVSLHHIDTPPAVRSLLEQKSYHLSSLGLGRSEPVEAKLVTHQGDSDEKVLEVRCGKGWLVVGGGCLGRRSTDEVEGVRDLTVNAFRCSSTTDTDDYTKKGFAICALSCQTLLDDPEPSEDSEDSDDEDSMDHYHYHRTHIGGHDVCADPDNPHDEKVIDPHHICRDEECTLAECCRTPPTCESYAGECTDALPRKKPAHEPCSSWTCSVEDCCSRAETCKEWGERTFTEKGEHGYCAKLGGCLLEVGNFDDTTCTKWMDQGMHAEPGECTAVDCCVGGATCETFLPSGGEHGCAGERLRDDTCCDGWKCDCADCFE